MDNEINDINDRPSGRAGANIPSEDFDYAQSVIRRLEDYFGSIIVGQTKLMRSMIGAVLADGHILIESVPGLAKTTAARAVADAVKGKFSRIQCTPDLLPGDILLLESHHTATNVTIGKKVKGDWNPGKAVTPTTPDVPTPDAPAPATTYYRVRHADNSSSSQIGAFTRLENAKLMVDANPGYYVFLDGKDLLINNF